MFDLGTMTLVSMLTMLFAAIVVSYKSTDFVINRARLVSNVVFGVVSLVTLYDIGLMIAFMNNDAASSAFSCFVMGATLFAVGVKCSELITKDELKDHC